MDLSLRNAARNCYHIAGNFSVVKDLLSKIAPGVNYLTADGNVFLQFILRPPVASNCKIYS